MRKAFVDGAHFIYGHTMMQRALGMGYQSDWAKRHLPSRRERSALYARLGATLPPGKPGLTMLAAVNLKMTPEQLLEQLTSDEVHD